MTDHQEILKDLEISNWILHGSFRSGTCDVNSCSDVVKRWLEGQNDILKYDFIPPVPDEEKKPR